MAIPSETTRGLRWLNNFSPDEKPYAALLLDSVEFIGQDEFRTNLQKIIEALPKTIAKPIALIPVRELQSNSYFGKDRNAKPRLLGPTSFPGSEAIIANIAGSLRRQKNNAGPFVASPSLTNMRNAKCRSVLFVDDFSGSGDRIAGFFEKFRNHKTIRSWESYGLIEYHVAAFSMTKKAFKRLARLFGQNNIHLVKFCPTFENQGWTLDQLVMIEKLCRDNANSENFALGHKSTRALLAFSHSAPNNLPAVLWQQWAGWAPFFKGKSVPIDLHPVLEEKGGLRSLKNSFANLRQVRLSRGNWEGISSNQLKTVLLILAGVNRLPKTEDHLVELTNLYSHIVDETLAFCRSLNLVGSNTLRLTDEGRYELNRAKNIVLPTTEAILSGSTAPYYPRSLRVGR